MQQYTSARFAARHLLAAAAALVLLFLLSASAQGQTITVSSYELGRGIVASNGVAVVRGPAFSLNSAQAQVPQTPTELAGVRVWIGGKDDGLLATIRTVNYQEIGIVMPNVPRAATWFFGWQRVDVESPLGNYTGWVVVMPVSAEIFTNHCHDESNCIDGLPFGGAWVNLQQVYPSLNVPIPNHNTQLWFYGSGWRNAAKVVAWIADTEGNYAMVECSVQPHPLFPGWDTVSLTLPVTINRDGVEMPLAGEITIQMAAQQPFPLRWWSFANAVKVTIE